MRGLLLVIPLCLLSLSASAQDGGPHYIRGGAGFGCSMSKADHDLSVAEKRDPCAHIGPLYVGMPREKVEAVLGKPTTLAKSGGVDYFAWPLAPGQPAPTYAAISFNPDGRARTVQVTGTAWPAAWQFNGITLGSTEADVRARLGEPLKLKPSGDPGAVEWAYDPWTFSLEVKGGVVSSIRVAE